MDGTEIIPAPDSGPPQLLKHGIPVMAREFISKAHYVHEPTDLGFRAGRRGRLDFRDTLPEKVSVVVRHGRPLRENLIQTRELRHTQSTIQVR